MTLSSDLISQLVKITNDEPERPKESTVYGTTVEYEGKIFVRIDGSDILTPFNNTSNIGSDERVIVMIKNHTATVTGNLSSPSARILTDGEGKRTVEGIIDSTYEINALTARIGTIESDYVKTVTLNAQKARIDTIESNYVKTVALDAQKARIDTIESNYVKTTELNAVNARIDSIIAGDVTAGLVTAEQLEAVSARVGTLEGATANIGDLTAKVGKIDTLIYGSASGSSIQSSFANSIVALIGDAKIKSAMIESINAAKITAGDIITDNVKVKSSAGRLQISGETMQISDSSRVRVQIGKDASNDYSINIWDASGNLMFSKGGITDKAIKEAIIVNDMVSDSADISASKLDIDSLFSVINNDNSHTLKATKVKLDEKNLTLEVAFEDLTTTVTDQGESISAQGESISAHGRRLTSIENTLSSEIWSQNIETLSNQFTQLSTNHSNLTQTVNGLSSTVTSHTTQIGNKADSSTVTAVNNKVTSLEQNLDGFKTTVSSTYANRYDLYRYNLIDKSSDAWTAITTGTNYTTIVSRTHCSKYGLKAGDQITFSLELRPEVKTGIKARIDFYSVETGEDGKIVYLGNTISKGAPGLSSVTATIPENAQYITLCFSNHVSTETTATTEYYRKIKLEKGAFATEWLPPITDTLRVGGANYLSNSHIHSSYAALKDGGEYYSSSTSTRQILLFQNLYLDPGRYTISCYIKQLNGDGEPVDTQTQIRVMKNSTSTFYNSEATSGEWTLCTVPLDVSSSSDSYTVYLRTYDSAGVNVEQVWVKKVKVEAGTVATDWTPAYADIDSRFTAAETSISQLNDRITASVTETTNLGTRTSTLEQTATGLTTRLNNQVIGGTNVLRGTNTVTTLGSSAAWSKGTWRTAGGGAGARSVIDVTDAPNALIKKGFSITADDSDTTTCQDYVPVVEGLEYTISCYARGSGTLRLQVGRSPYSVRTFTLSNVTTWTKCSMTFVAGDGNGMTDGCTNAYFGNRGTAGTTLEVCGFKMEVGNIATDWTPSPYDTDVAVSNFMRFDSAGLMIADMSASTIGNNVLIDSDSVDIRKGNTTLASFSANKVILGQNAENSVIDLCNGAGTISSLISEASTSVPHRDSILISSQEVHTKSIHFKANVSNAYGASSTPTISREAELYMIRSTSTSTESCARLQAQHTTNSSGAYTKSGFSAMTYDSASSTRALIFASNSANSAYNQINVYPTKTTFNKPLYRYDAGTEYQVFDSSMDSGWKDATIGSDFVVYSSDANSKVRYRKFGKIVEIRGAVKPTAAWAAGDDNRTIFTLPTGYRPSSQITVKCQGSGAYSWLLSITNAGVVRCARYNNGSEYIAYGTGSWLPFNATFMID